MMTLEGYFISFVLLVAFIFYVLFGGADFGAGAFEGLSKLLKFSGRAVLQNRINKVVGPVWEANHVWLILIVVILFVGFPILYQTMSIYLHIPLLAVLFGVVIRGTSFTFRNYTTENDPYIKWYDGLFYFSSFWTPIWLGVTFSSMSRGFIHPEATSFYDLYIHSWLGFYPFCVGFFTLSIFVFLATVYLAGETGEDHKLRKYCLKSALISNVCMIFFGALVLGLSLKEGSLLAKNFFTNPISLSFFGLATFGVAALWWSIFSDKVILVRCAAGFLVLMILGGWFAAHGFYAVVTMHGAIDLPSAQAPVSVQFPLCLALIVGVIIILPSLFLLFKLFTGKKKAKPMSL